LNKEVGFIVENHFLGEIVKAVIKDMVSPNADVDEKQQ
jgi:hypothetical protein